ncbi:glycosyltransferase family 4 protein [uncultured Thiodictyon sp.]|uniref:glycosyltransferase family 4 protein n=1 Tax=uncultured Thiodictyon sp. TaxID=1846217 RepID=UPI0025F4AC61|nr:glycosyltransferase family 4 protein [uncultured Thiodictyon sp.]
MKILALVPEAHGGFGGIAVYNRDLIDACCALPYVQGLKLLPRHLRSTPEDLPAKVEIAFTAAAGLAAFTRQVAKAAIEHYDLILCTHIYLLPYARAAQLGRRVPIIGVIYGTEAWRPTGRLLVDRLSRSCDGLISISEFTSARFREWSGVAAGRVGILPNAVHTETYGSGPKPTHLIDRYDLAGKRVIMTLGRLDARERQKGIDELIALMPRLLAEMPDLVYLVAGDGDDQPRLAAKVAAAELQPYVKFAGRISEDEKADHYRLCDVYSMAGRQEGFGFVFLEALATGAPVVASVLDGSRDAVLDGKLGELANPDDPESLRAALVRALAKPRGVPTLLDYFSFDHFVERLDRILTAFAPNNLP